MPALDPDPDHGWIDALNRAARQLPADDALAQVFYEERVDLRVELRSGAPGSTVATHLRGGRVRRRGLTPRTVFVSAPSPDDLEAVAQRGVTVAPAPSDHERSAPPADPNPESVLSWLEGLASRVEAAARGDEVRIAARWAGFTQRVYIARPSGEVLYDLRRGSTVRVEARIEGPGGREGQAVWETVLKPTKPRPAFLEQMRSLADRARSRLDARPVQPGEIPVVLAPGVGGVLVHELIGHALEGDTVLRGASSLGSRGSRVAPDDVTVADDPRRGRGAWRIDDDGVECGATSLIEAGRVGGCLHDLSSAMRSGARPTGHGRRSSFREPVGPRMGCTFLAPGRLEADEILADTPRGIYIRRMEAASTDSLSGSARFLVTDADRVDRGHLVHPVRPFLLELSARSALRSLDRIGDDLEFDTCVGSCVRDGQPLATSVGAPTIRIGVAMVAG